MQVTFKSFNFRLKRKENDYGLLYSQTMPYSKGWFQDDLDFHNFEKLWQRK